MQTPESHMTLKSGRFSIEKYHYENLGLTERMVSMFLSGVLMTRGTKRPFKGQFLYGAYMAYRAFSGRCLVYEHLGIDASRPRAVNIRGSFEIGRPAAEVYSYWRNLKDLLIRINHLLDVEIKDDQLSHWKASVIGNLFTLDWDAEIVKDEPGRLIGWRATQGSVFQHVGRIQFEETADGMGTIMKIVLSYHPSGGGVGLGLARLLSPYFEGLLKKEIRNFKHAVELVNDKSFTKPLTPVGV